MNEYKPEKVLITIEGIMLPTNDGDCFWEIIGNGEITTSSEESIKDHGNIENFRLEIPKNKIKWKNY